MSSQFEIPQAMLDRLMDENIGKAELGDEKLADKTHVAGTTHCLPTTVIRTKGLC